MNAARYHGEWCKAQRPTEYAYVHITLAGTAQITVPKGERWLLRAWGCADLTTPVVGGGGFAAQLDILHKDTQAQIPLDIGYVPADANLSNMPNAIKRAEINPIILEEEDTIYITNLYGGTEEDVLKCYVWYEALTTLDKQPEEENNVK